MGVYLSQPITDKVSNDYESAWLKCGVSSMQGWRSSQEDAHNCVLDYDEEMSFFAVYDGHGGHEVAEYTARNLPDFLKKIESYKTGNFEKALIDSFIDFDATLTEEAVVAKLKVIADENSASQGQDKDEDEVDVAELKEEANMPLSELIAKYASGGGKNPALRRVSGDSSSQPASPYLKAKSSPTGKKDCAGCSKDGNSEVPVVNGVPETNGETDEKDSGSSEGKSTHAEKGDSTDGECSSSSVNGEHSEEKASDDGEKKEEISEKAPEEESPEDEEKKRIKSTIRIAKKKATVTMLAQLFEDNDTGSESDENDESFHAKDTVNDDEEEEEEVEGEDEEEGDEEGEEEEESDEDDSIHLSDVESAGSESGCAAVVALLHKNKLYVANAGDSRAVLCRDGNAVDLSVDHKPDDEIERQRIVAAGGTVTHDGRVNGGLNLSRALGDHYYKKCPEVDAKSQMITALPDIQIADISPGKDEFLVLACDGIWNSLSSQEVVDFVRPLLKEGQKLSSICEKLFEKCLAPDTMGDGTGCDNMTCIIVTFSLESGDSKATLSPTDSSSDSCKRSASPSPDESNKRPKVESPST